MAKSPFVSYTPEQVFAYESVTYVIVTGSDFFDVDGKYFFTKNSAIRYYNKILRHLGQAVQSGTKKERREAKRVLNSLRVEPMRIH
jgi:hypothetical protein